jgi:hypothetical protein
MASRSFFSRQKRAVIDGLPAPLAGLVVQSNAEQPIFAIGVRREPMPMVGRTRDYSMPRVMR